MDLLFYPFQINLHEIILLFGLEESQLFYSRNHDINFYRAVENLAW